MAMERPAGVTALEDKVATVIAVGTTFVELPQSVTLILKELAPVPVGVPWISPVVAPGPVSPTGSEPLLSVQL